MCGGGGDSEKEGFYEGGKTVETRPLLNRFERILGKRGKLPRPNLKFANQVMASLTKTLSGYSDWPE